VVFIPKYRRKTLYKELRRHVGAVFRALAEQRECRIEDGHMQDDHVHMMISIPPKYSVAQVIGYWFLCSQTCQHAEPKCDHQACGDLGTGSNSAGWRELRRVVL